VQLLQRAVRWPLRASSLRHQEVAAAAAAAAAAERVLHLPSASDMYLEWGMCRAGATGAIVAPCGHPAVVRGPVPSYQADSLSGEGTERISEGSRCCSIADGSAAAQRLSSVRLRHRLSSAVQVVLID